MDLETLYRSCCASNSNWFVEEMYSTEWTREEDKQFESAIAKYDNNTPDWEMVAAMIPSKNVLDVMKHYEKFVEDMAEIEADRVPVPEYLTVERHDGCKKRPATSMVTSHQDRRKGVPWTAEEHERFLTGLGKYGKGDWKNIARHCVMTRTPTQVASHAQKHFLRLKLSEGKDNKRKSSIHDITNDNLKEPTTNSGQDKPILFNEDHMPNVQREGINHHNEEPLMEAPNPNYDDMFMSPSSDIYSQTLKFQGQQDLYECLFHHAYAQQKAQGFRTASNDINKDSVLDTIHAL